MTGMIVLTLLMVSKVAYVESFRSFYTFYLIERFGVSIPTSQIMLFVFLLAQAVGVLIGGIVGDRIGRYRIIWISVLGPLPFTLLLPYADFFWTGVLTVVISLIIASAFASILIYAIELLPERVGRIGGCSMASISGWRESRRPSSEGLPTASASKASTGFAASCRWPAY